jgi:two-component system, chemotaxis family, CheB/CheR fusion protein
MAVTSDKRQRSLLSTRGFAGRNPALRHRLCLALSGYGRPRRMPWCCLAGALVAPEFTGEGALPRIASVNDLFIVGIGVSAGGIEALEELFRPMPSDTGMAFVVVAHLAPNKASFLDEIVGRFTAMPVARPSDGVEVEANHVYVIAPDTTLTLDGGRLRVQPQVPAGQRTTNRIDQLFNSLAEHQAEHAIGVVLSGGGSDGTVGIKAIKEQGGLTVTQGTDHSMPRYGGMPSSAIATGLVDLVAPVEEMAAKLVAYVDSFGSTDHLAEPKGDGPADEAAVDARRQICAILRDQVGHDFGGYKEKTFLRRVQRRMQVVQLAEVAAYIERLRQDPEEVTLLFRDFLIGVTNFFRDQEAFEALAKLVVPRLFEGKSEGGAARVWVPGCATGEEVYSIAILLREHLETLRTPAKVQVFGTDIDEAALAVARAARYPAAVFDGTMGRRLRRFFTEDGGTYVVAKEVRDTCIFSVHSVVRDPPFSRIDLVSCRNLLIYLGAELQAQVVPVLHYALRPDGYLFLGIAESVTQHAALFAPLDKKHRIFRRRAGAPADVVRPPPAVGYPRRQHGAKLADGRSRAAARRRRGGARALRAGARRRDSRGRRGLPLPADRQVLGAARGGAEPPDPRHGAQGPPARAARCLAATRSRPGAR